MTPTPLDLYQRGISAVLDAPDAAAAYRLVTEDGIERPLELRRWLGEPTVADRALLARALGPVLDVGCGPGRHVLALHRRGVTALGLDIAPLAVRVARRRGAPALQRSVFDRLPGGGRWATVLLLDGNLGIGGDPLVLLRRVAGLLRLGGCALVEAEPPGIAAPGRWVRIIGPDGVSGSFPWAQVGIDQLAGLAAQTGFAVAERWDQEGRCFARLRRCSPAH